MIYFLICKDCKKEFGTTNPNEERCKSCIRKLLPGTNDEFLNPEDKDKYSKRVVKDRSRFGKN